MEIRTILRTHKASTGIAERGPLAGDLVEVMQEVEAQLGADRHPPHEVGGDLLLADLPFPVREEARQTDNHIVMVSAFRISPMVSLSDFSCSTSAFRPALPINGFTWEFYLPGL